MEPPKPWEQYLRYLSNVLDQEVVLNAIVWQGRGYKYLYPKNLLTQRGWQDMVCYILLELKSFGEEALQDGKRLVEAYYAERRLKPTPVMIQELEDWLKEGGAMVNDPEPIVVSVVKLEWDSYEGEVFYREVWDNGFKTQPIFPGMETNDCRFLVRKGLIERQLIGQRR